MINRTTAIAIMLAVTMALSGCSILTGEGASYVAEESGVDESTVAETGFTLERTEWQNQSRDIDVAGEERTINVSTHVSAYSWGEDEGAFAVFSTPQVNLASQTMNPIAEMSNEEIVERFQDGFEGQDNLQDLEQEEEYTTDIAGEERAVTVFSATAVQDGQEVDVLIHVTKFEDGEDIVVGAAVHPASADQVRTDVETMFGGIEH